MNHVFTIHARSQQQIKIRKLMIIAMQLHQFRCGLSIVLFIKVTGIILGASVNKC